MVGEGKHVNWVAFSAGGGAVRHRRGRHLLNRKNLIVLMAIELMLLAVNTNFVAFCIT
jgi:hypothetical protein